MYVCEYSVTFLNSSSLKGIFFMIFYWRILFLMFCCNYSNITYFYIKHTVIIVFFVLPISDITLSKIRDDLTLIIIWLDLIKSNSKYNIIDLVMNFCIECFYTMKFYLNLTCVPLWTNFFPSTVITSLLLCLLYFVYLSFGDDMVINDICIYLICEVRFQFSTV